MMLMSFLLLVSEEYAKVYLVIYNLFQFVGFIYVLAVMGIRYSRDGPGTFISAKSYFLRIFVCKLCQNSPDNVFLILHN